MLLLLLLLLPLLRLVAFALVGDAVCLLLCSLCLSVRVSVIYHSRVVQVCASLVRLHDARLSALCLHSPLRSSGAQELTASQLRLHASFYLQ